MKENQSGKLRVLNFDFKGVVMAFARLFIFFWNHELGFLRCKIVEVRLSRKRKIMIMCMHNLMRFFEFYCNGGF